MKFHKAKKRLGQNFLKSSLALNKMIEEGDISNNDTILEVGPGKGALTKKLLEKAGKVIAIEKDRDLIEILEEKFEKELKEGKLILINEDILKYKPTLPYKLIANIPYNITGAILKKFLNEDILPKKILLMVQHEVAKRIIANDKNESILSISVKAYGTPKTIMKVPKRYFSPSPKVDSAILAITDISKDLFKKGDIKEETFWDILHCGFAHKRKILISNLKNYDKEIDWVNIFTDLNIDKKTRAQKLSITDWVNLTKKIG